MKAKLDIISASQIEALHDATLELLATTGVTINSEEALQILGDAGADVSNSNHVKIPVRLIEEALKNTKKNIILFTREGKPYIHLDGSMSYFGAIPDCPDILDPYSHKRRQTTLADVSSLTRLVDFLPNLTWIMTTGTIRNIPPLISDRVSFMQAVLNTSKPVGCAINNVESLKSMIEICTIISGGLQKLSSHPFFYCSVEPITPLVHGKDAVEKSLFCAENGIPNVIYSMPMAGATSPATFAGTLVVSNAEFLSHLVIVQLKKPGSPVIYGSMPNIMDMKTSIYPYGSPELGLLTACLTAVSHYYGLPMWGTAGVTDAKVIGTQAGLELMYECILSLQTGADFIHDIGFMDHATMISPELIVLMDEIIDMVKVSMKGIEINKETIALKLIDSVGPGGSYIDELHTLKHFRDFWVPSVLDRSRLVAESSKSTMHCEDLVNEKTKEILENHFPCPLPDDIVKEIQSMEKSWYKEYA